MLTLPVNSNLIGPTCSLIHRHRFRSLIHEEYPACLFLAPHHTKFELKTIFLYAYSMMDPVSGFGAAVGAMQVIGYSFKLIKTATRLTRSASGITTEMQERELAARDLIESMKQLSTNTAKEQDKSLQAICDSCFDVAEELLVAVGAAKRDAVGSQLKILSRAFRTLRKNEKIIGIEARLSKLKHDLNTRFTFESRQKLDFLIEKITRVEEKIDFVIAPHSSIILRQGTIPNLHASSQITHEIDTSACTLELSQVEMPTVKSTRTLPDMSGKASAESSNEETVQSTQDYSKLTQHSIQVRSPPSFRCDGSRCSCSCHLGRYKKSPFFLKALFGALSFRGTCSNHVSNLWELKYWIPEWASNYNIYLLFERSACGSPLLVLRFPWKITWGTQDTIIRFSLLGDTSGIKSILDSGKGSLYDVDPNHGRTALHYAVMRNQVEACTLLLHAGADRFIEDESDTSATQKAWEHIFTRRGPPAVLETFKTLFPNDELDHWGFSPLHKAILDVEGFTLSQFFDSGKVISEVGIDTVDSEKRTALHWAALRGDLEAVKLLLDARADVHALDMSKCTPLTYAASAAVPRIVELLILSGANVNHTNRRGDSPLHYAARHKNDLESVRILVRAGASVDRKNTLGNTPFAGAAIANKTAAGRYLLQEGANRYSTNKYGDTPLRETIYHNCHSFLSMLLEDDTSYDDTNSSGSSLLHAVALEGDIKTIQILKDAHLSGLDHGLRNNKGQTAMDVCLKREGALEGFQQAFLGLLLTVEATPSFRN